VKCPHCGYIISEPRRRQQSRMVHKLIRSYADAVGYDAAFAKQLLKYNYGAFVDVPVEPDKLAAWHPPDWAGQFVEVGGVVVSGGRSFPHLVFLKSETEFTLDEESDFIDFCIRECARVDAELRWLDDYESSGAEAQNRLPAGEDGSVAGV
jgi:endogenous inhibitor of DNA gyrase (YacG/DUF329 family)